MNLKTLTNEALNANLKFLVKSERELLSEILLSIAEVDRRKLFLKLAYPNLFEYLTRELGYSFGSAQRRIDAARLMQSVPELKAKLESGEMNLSQVSFLQKSIRQKTKETGIKISSAEKQSLVKTIEGKSWDETQSLIAQTLNLEIRSGAHAQTQSDESVRLELTLSKEQWQKLKHARELLSNSLPSGSWDQMLEYISDQVIKQKTKEKLKKNAEKPNPDGAKSKKRRIPAQRPSIPTSLRREILGRDRGCQHEDPRSKRKCGSKWNLHIDHIEPVWAGGKSELQNLRILCAAHNLNRYREQSRIQ